MCDNARTGISSAASRYLQLIDQNEENGEANLDYVSSDAYSKFMEDEDGQNDSLMRSFNNPFAENGNKQEDSFMKSCILERNEREADEQLENSFMKAINNPFVEERQKPKDNQQDILMKSFDNPFAEYNQNPIKNSIKFTDSILDSTDILIEDSEACFKPETSQMSFMSIRENQNSLLVPTRSTSDKSLEFGSSSSKSFLSPPHKRFCFSRPESFFDKSNLQQSTATESFFNKAGNTNCTEDIFNANFMKDKTFQSINPFSEAPSTNMMFRLSSTENESDCSSGSDSDLTMKDVSSKINESSKQDFSLYSKGSKNLSSNFSNTNFNDEKENAAAVPQKKSRKVNTFYQAPPILDTEKIDEFYKKHNSIDWKSGDIDLNYLMEPSLDYVIHRLNCLKPLTTGRKEQIINCDDEDAFNCDSINQSIEEIKDSFEKGNFICSTPEEPENTDENGGTNPLNVGFLNLPSDALQSASPRAEENIDDDRTRSFLVNKESENVWSAITHVSCSVPLNEQESEPIFDITTIFDYSNLDNLPDDQTNQFKCLDNDTARYELLLSLLNENNPLDKTTTEVQETLKIAQNRKAAIMSQIEMIIQALVCSLVNHETMIIKLHRIKDWKDCKYESNVLSQKETAITIKSLSFTNKNTERTFTIVVHLLGEIYKLLGQNMTITKRELYYRDVELTKSQVSVNKAIDEICALLNVQCWELGVLSTSKGLVAGDLRILTDEDEIIDYSTTNSVPQKPSGIKAMESKAEYVLVVEKDTVFTRLIEDNIMEKIGRKIILITAKGYPDVNTRLLLKRIETELQKPIYIIVDADAYGIDIMCTYKFGSLQMVNFSEQLAITKMEWIGIHPTDIEKLDITRTQLTDADKKKVDELLARPYMNEYLKNELEHLKNRGLKAEIESIYHYSIDYLVHDYIPQKIAAICSPLQDIIQGSKCFKENLLS